MSQPTVEERGQLAGQALQEFQQEIWERYGFRLHAQVTLANETNQQGQLIVTGKGSVGLIGDQNWQPSDAPGPYLVEGEEEEVEETSRPKRKRKTKTSEVD